MQFGETIRAAVIRRGPVLLFLGLSGSLRRRGAFRVALPIATEVVISPLVGLNGSQRRICL